MAVVRRRRSSLRGDSIRSLRGLLQSQLSSSSLVSLQPDHDDDEGEITTTATNSRKELTTSKEEEEEDEEKNQQQQPQQEEEECDDNDNSASPSKTIGAGAALQLGKRDADQMRSRLLHNLGIPQKELQQLTEKNRNEVVISNPSPTNNEWDEVYEVPLNDDEGYSAHGKLQFFPIVKVIPIPSHKVYSNRIRQTIWTSAYELQEQVARNSLEFSFENWDPNLVLTEETGLVFHEGEWIHPAHIEYIYPEQPPILMTEEEMWKQTCQKLGIQPAEYYHSLPPSSSSPEVGNGTTTNAKK